MASVCYAENRCYHGEEGGVDLSIEGNVEDTRIYGNVPGFGYDC